MRACKMEGRGPMKSFNATPEDPEEVFRKALLERPVVWKTPATEVQSGGFRHIKPGAAATFEMPKQNMLIWKGVSNSSCRLLVGLGPPSCLTCSWYSVYSNCNHPLRPGKGRLGRKLPKVLLIKGFQPQNCHRFHCSSLSFANFGLKRLHLKLAVVEINVQFISS